jgi:hypothetical protein
LGLNPGWIRPTDFYNTTNDAQSKFNWGGHGYQTGPDYNDVAWNQAYGSETPWGVQQLAKPLTGQQIADLIAGKNVPEEAITRATRRYAYDAASMATPSAANTYQLPVMANSSFFNTGSSGNTANYTNNAQYNQVASVLGADLARQQQLALAQGDTATVQRIQSQYEYALLNQGGGF